MYLLIYLFKLTCFAALGLTQAGYWHQDIEPVKSWSPATTSIPFPTQGVSNQEEKSVADCTSPDLLLGSCKPLIECSTLITRLQSSPVDDTFRRYLKLSNTICKGQYAVVCCPNAIQEPIKHLPIFPTNSDEIPSKLPTMADGCGHFRNEFRGLVFGPSSKPGNWPWITLIGYAGGISAPTFKCGGALITSRHVLTAAHCITSELAFVRLGEYDLSTDTETNHLDIRVVKSLVHPQYNRIDGHNDIALLYLGENVEFSEKITPICIPIDEPLRSKNLTNYNPFIAGWGKTMESGKSATVLQELQIPIYGNEDCKKLYKDEGKYISEDQFDNAVLCAGHLGGGIYRCQGDSGGPLVFPEKYEKEVRYHLIGITSSGFGCGKTMIPGLYSKVVNFIDWIEKGVADTPYLLGKM